MMNIKIMAMVGICSMGLIPNSYGQTKEQKRPNILFIMSDDHAYQAISAYGSGLNSTPNIDRIAKGGAIFNKAFVTNSICAPSRAVMLSGKFSHLNGKKDNLTEFNWDQPSFPKILQANGYQTALIGKIHLEGNPQGFDYSNVLPGQGDYYNPDFIENGVKKRFQGYVTTLTTQFSLDWLDKKRDKSKPFCLLYHQKAPHRAWVPERKYYREFIHKEIKEPSTYHDDYSGRGTAAKSATMRICRDQTWNGDSKLFPEVTDKLGIKQSGIHEANLERMDQQQRASWDSIYGPMNVAFEKEYPNMTEPEICHWRYERFMQDYLACIQSVDDGVGEMLDYLDKNGLADNTIVVYTSDQGMNLGEHGWFDKRFMYEESFRTPLLIRYPKEIKPGTVISQMVQNLDFAPTFLNYAGVNIPKDMQGESFRKLLNGESVKWRDAIYYHYYEYPAVHSVKRHYGVRTDRYKLIHFYYDVDEWELYDLEKDPQEMKSVYNDPAYAQIRAQLHLKLNDLRVKYKDTADDILPSIKGKK